MDRQDQVPDRRLLVTRIQNSPEMPVIWFRCDMIQSYGTAAPVQLLHTNSQVKPSHGFIPPDNSLVWCACPQRNDDNNIAFVQLEPFLS